jgi:hypothetical protein
MQKYFESLQDDFFDPSHEKSSPEIQPYEPPTSLQHKNDLFSTPAPAAPTPVGERMLGVQEMHRMTKESASEPRRYGDLATPSPNADPLFTLDQGILDDHELETSATEQEKDTSQLSSDESEVVSLTDASKTTSLFGGGAELENEELDSFPVADETEEKTESAKPKKVDQTDDLFASDELVPLFADNVSDAIGNEHTTPDSSDNESDMPKGTLPHPDEHASMPQTSQDASMPLMEEETPTSETVEEALASKAARDSETISHERRWEASPESEDIFYEKFAYMGQKFRNMMHQFPQREEHEDGVVTEVRDFIHMVSTRDYAESQIEAAIARYQELKEMGRLAEAAQMLIAAATTESTFAQFMLARELFKGEVLEKNFPESFTQINSLAEEDYPEAICDLGQLYEYGIGIGKNKRHALLLYEEAAEMGVERAKGHCERLKNKNPIQSIKSLTSSFLRKKKK